MELQGLIHEVQPVTSGQGKNGEWYKRLIVVDVPGDKYPKKVAVTLWGDLANTDYSRGDEIKLQCSVESREYNGKWYTDVKAYRVDSHTTFEKRIEQEYGTPEHPATPQQQPSQEYQDIPVDDDLPF